MHVITLVLMGKHARTNLFCICLNTSWLWIDVRQFKSWGMDSLRQMSDLSGPLDTFNTVSPSQAVAIGDSQYYTRFNTNWYCDDTYIRFFKDFAVPRALHLCFRGFPTCVKNNNDSDKSCILELAIRGWILDAYISPMMVLTQLLQYLHPHVISCMGSRSNLSQRWQLSISFSLALSFPALL